MAGSTKIVLLLAVGVLTVMGAYFAFIPDHPGDPEFILHEPGDDPEASSSDQARGDAGRTAPSTAGSGGATRNDRSGLLSDAARDLLSSERGAAIPDLAEHSAADDGGSTPTADGGGDASAGSLGWDAAPADVGPPAPTSVHVDGSGAPSDGGKDLPVSPALTRPTNDDPPVLPREPVAPLTASPAANTPAAVPGASTGSDTYVVKEGDTLTAVAQWWFGDAAKWDLIQDANPGLTPQRLQIGQRIKLPAKGAARATPPAAANRAYTVRPGDTLVTIARARYGRDAKWRAIYEANKAVIGSNPDDLEVGMVLTIPN